MGSRGSSLFLAWLGGPWVLQTPAWRVSQGALSWASATISHPLMEASGGLWPWHPRYLPLQGLPLSGALCPPPLVLQAPPEPLLRAPLAPQATVGTVARGTPSSLHLLHRCWTAGLSCVSCTRVQHTDGAWLVWGEVQGLLW